MFTNIVTPQAAQQSAGFGMPGLGRDRVASVRVLPTTGVVSAAIAGSTATFEGTVACGYRHINDVAVKGAFPGASAWSPPV
ncbi:MAG: hypothetical protein H0V42_01570 [Nocardioidaceae bacterium]|nr:hypothetical protein [Nocardioidaceae bacterium]